MKMKALRKVMAALIAAFCIVGVFAVVGCGKSDEQQIKSSLETQLSDLKNADDATLNEYFSDLQSTFERFGLTPSQFFSAFLTNYDYKINDVKIEGEKATANCDISSTDFSQVLTVFSNNFETWAASEEGLAVVAAADENALYAKAGEFLLAAMKDPSIGVVKTNVDIKYELKDKSWTPVDTSNLETALLGGYTG